ncbi:MAG: tryptophan-rich sensory protein [Clostridia bacterium]|nr:tryptophan-rich sensory protein [Clostridia bacterium]
MWHKIRPYVLFIAAALGTGGAAAFLTRNDMDIYTELTTPPLAPPSILFPIVWTVLYVLMGVGAALVYERKKEFPGEAHNALLLFGENLVLNFAWSLIFFRFRAFLLAFIWLLLLLLVIIRMIIAFVRVRPIAGYLQIPYAVWVTFAGYLNLGIYLLNK